MLQLKRSVDKRMFFFFYSQVYFSFSFSGKKTEYSLIYKGFTEVFLIARIPYSTVNSFSSKGEGNLLTFVVGSLTA